MNTWKSVFIKLLSGSGCALIMIGCAKILHHSAANPFLNGICGDGNVFGYLMFGGKSGAHCWGCPTATLGFALTIAGFLVATGDNHHVETASI
ncbi:MAG: hypothetical protein AAF478_03425 [Pseudomonadota bacterium]